LRSNLWGGDWLKFGNVIVATASLVLIGIMLQTVLRVVFLSIGSAGTNDTLAWIIAFLVTSLIVGYVFALRIQEQSRIKAIGKIFVLSSLTVMLLIWVAWANPLVSPGVKDGMETMFSTSGWTNYEWSVYTAFLATMVVVVVMVFIFIGLYAGSMLKKPKKT
jgi:hypothetical protein